MTVRMGLVALRAWCFALRTSLAIRWGRRPAPGSGPLGDLLALDARRRECRFAEWREELRALLGPGRSRLEVAAAAAERRLASLHAQWDQLGRPLPAPDEGRPSGALLLLLVMTVGEAAIAYQILGALTPDAGVLVAVVALVAAVCAAKAGWGLGTALRRRATSAACWHGAALVAAFAALGAARVWYAGSDPGPGPASIDLGDPRVRLVAVLALQALFLLLPVAQGYVWAEPIAGLGRLLRAMHVAAEARDDARARLELAEAHLQSRLDRLTARQVALDLLADRQAALARPSAEPGHANATPGRRGAGIARSLVAGGLALVVLSGCGVGRGRRPEATVIWVDRSGSMSDYREARQVLAAVAGRLEPGDRVVLASAGARTLDAPAVALDSTLPAGDPLYRLDRWVGLETQQAASRRAASRRALEGRLMGLLDSLLAEPGQPGSSLLDALERSAAVLRTGAEDPRASRLVLVSDGMENSEWADWTRELRRPEAAATLVLRRRWPDPSRRPVLTQSTVYLISLRGRTPGHTVELITTWRSLLQGLGVPAQTLYVPATVANLAGPR